MPKRTTRFVLFAALAMPVAALAQTPVPPSATQLPPPLPAITGPAPAAPVSVAPPPCSTPDYRAFDFWVGEWDVFPNGSGTQVATSSIETMFGGCAIRETWKPLKGAGGGSFSHYDGERRYWRQAWVDGSGARVDFDGGPVDGKMVLTGRWANVVAKGQDGLIRMTYAKNADGSVRQFGEQSVDHGLSWTTSFDFIYRPQKAGEK